MILSIKDNDNDNDRRFLFPASCVTYFLFTMEKGFWIELDKKLNTTLLPGSIILDY